MAHADAKINVKVTRRNLLIRSAGLAIIDVEEIITDFAEASIESQSC